MTVNHNVNIHSSDSQVETPSSAKKSTLDTRKSWLVWICASLFYLYECILRVSPSVMTEGLMRDFSLTSTSLGVLVSFYLYSYTILQVPCGVMVDALGPRKIITISAALCSIGAYFFGVADSLYLAQFGRFLIGAGSACAFISCCKISAEWFSPSKFAIMSGMTTMMGTVGGTFGGPPFAWLVNNGGGWRTSMLLMAVAGVFVTIFSWVMIKDYPDNRKSSISKELPLNRSLAILLKNPQVWLIALFGSLMWLPIIAFAEIWGVPYLMYTYDITNEYASFATSMIFVGFSIGSPLTAWLSDYFESRLKAMRFSATCLLFIFSAIVFGPEVPLFVMFILLFLAGVCNGGQVLAFACVKEISPRRVSGTAVGLTNMVVMMSGVVFQPLLGKLLDCCWDGAINIDGIRLYSVSAYQSAIIAIPAALAVCWLILRFVKETHHSSREKRPTS
jgi:sugar phosphate permease